jgi:hypothetical protein
VPHPKLARLRELLKSYTESPRHKQEQEQEQELIKYATALANTTSDELYGTILKCKGRSCGSCSGYLPNTDAAKKCFIYRIAEGTQSNEGSFRLYAIQALAFIESWYY